ncbi:MAG: alpha/beta hydrolase-fold protein [Bacteroidota bacterium]
MQQHETEVLLTENLQLSSAFLERIVTITCFFPRQELYAYRNPIHLLLINDGQNMEELGLAGILSEMLTADELAPLACVAIHSARDRKVEYGTASSTDYMGRGAKAGAYAKFVLEELMPFISATYGMASFASKSFAGFSLGGLSALDIVWNHPQEFLRVGVFSGSLWWRTRALENGYQEETDRIMHAQVRAGGYYPWLKFFFETGTQDETMDRNNNGIIDAIDDTLGLVAELVAKGYNRQKDIRYLELKEGRHDIATWACAMPVFLKWGWGR